ncbi:MAG: FAD-dependent oxidoreductase, partial [Pseudomonadota bacterium]
LGQIFTDPRLRQLFGRYSTYTGSSPFEAPATLALIAHAERVGVWLVEGGMVQLPIAIGKAAATLGASIRYETHVDVVQRSGRRFALELSTGNAVEADAIVFNGDVNAMASGLLGDALRGALPDRRSESRSLSALTWSLCTSDVDFQLEHHTVFFGGDYPAEFRALKNGVIADEPTVYVCAQDRHNGARPAAGQSERLFLLINAPPTRLRNEQLENAQSSAMASLRRQGFGVALDDDSVERRTPDDFGRLFPGSEGAIYGWPTHGWSGSFRRAGAETTVPGLFCAGGTVHPGPGIPMAAQSGRIAAAKVRDYLSR